MPRLLVKKVVVVCFLEAVKTVMDQLGQFRLEMAQQGQPGPRNLATIYGDYRRLRDYLQRCAGTFPENAELDLETEDLALLVASLRRAVEATDERLELRGIAESERDWLKRKVQVWSDWAVELAQKPLLELPIPRTNAVLTTRVRALNARINNKIYLENKINAPVDSGMFHGVTLSSAPSSGRSTGAGDVMTPTPASAPPAGGDLHPLEFGLAEIKAEAPPGHRDSPGGSVGVAHLLDSRQIQDPRLRSLMVMDLRAFERARAADDHRLSAVHLASILECALLDYALPRRQELVLVGAPDTWNPQEILIRVMGEQCTPKDRSLAYHLFMARNLLRPVTQLVSPTVVTAASLGKLLDFVGVALRTMGLRSPYREGGDRGLELTPPTEWDAGLD